MADSIMGKITEVDGNSLKIEALARFAVDEHNKNSLLQFESVEKAKKQVVEGMLYYIALKAVVGDKKQVYEAKVYVKEWEHFKELQEFKHLLTGDAPSGPSA